MQDLTAREVELLIGEAMPGYEGVMWRLKRVLDAEVYRGTARIDVCQAISVLLYSVTIETAARISGEIPEAEKTLQEIWTQADQICKRSSRTILAMRLARNKPGEGS